MPRRIYSEENIIIKCRISECVKLLSKILTYIACAVLICALHNNREPLSDDALDWMMLPQLKLFLLYTVYACGSQ